MDTRDLMNTTRKQHNVPVISKTYQTILFLRDVGEELDTIKGWRFSFHFFLKKQENRKKENIHISGPRNFGSRVPFVFASRISNAISLNLSSLQ